MTTIVTRSGKGSPLTHVEVDTNFTNLNTNKLEAGAIALGSAATPSISFTGDTNTGIYSPGADQVAVATNGVERVEFGATEVVFNDTGVNYDFRIEGDTVDSLFFVDASTDRVGIGVTSPGNTLHVENPAAFDAQILAKQTASSAGVCAIRAQSNSAIVDLMAGGSSYGTNYMDQDEAGLITQTAGDSMRFNIGGSYCRWTFGSSEKARLDSSGRLLVGTTSARTLLSQSMGIQIETTDYPASGLSIVNNQNADANPLLLIGKSRGTTLNSNTIVNSGDTLGEIHFLGADGSAMLRAARISCLVDATPAATKMPGRLVFSTATDASPSVLTERMKIDSLGNCFVTYNILMDSTGTSGGRLYVNGTSNNQSIATSSSGNGSTTLYIGNAAIQVSSDARLKNNIENTQLDALDAVERIKVKDFTWNDPTDTSYNNRNARGKWTGLIAQELVDVLPFAVNAPRKEEDGSIDYDSDSIWTLDQSQLCPVLIKAVQQQQEIIAALESRITALESA